MEIKILLYSSFRCWPILNGAFEFINVKNWEEKGFMLSVTDVYGIYGQGKENKTK